MELSLGCCCDALHAMHIRNSELVTHNLDFIRKLDPFLTSFLRGWFFLGKFSHGPRHMWLNVNVSSQSNCFPCAYRGVCKNFSEEYIFHIWSNVSKIDK